MDKRKGLIRHSNRWRANIVTDYCRWRYEWHPPPESIHPKLKLRDAHEADGILVHWVEHGSKLWIAVRARSVEC